jgi:hypothetical protein
MYAQDGVPHMLLSQFYCLHSPCSFPQQAGTSDLSHSARNSSIKHRDGGNQKHRSVLSNATENKLIYVFLRQDHWLNKYSASVQLDRLKNSKCYNTETAGKHDTSNPKTHMLDFVLTIKTYPFEPSIRNRTHPVGHWGISLKMSAPFNEDQRDL